MQQYTVKRQTDRQTHRQTDTQTDRQTITQTHIQTYHHTDTQTDTQTETWKDRPTDFYFYFFYLGVLQPQIVCENMNFLQVVLELIRSPGDQGHFKPVFQAFFGRNPPPGINKYGVVGPCLEQGEIE